MKNRKWWSAPFGVVALALLSAADVACEEVRRAPSAAGLTIDPNPAICFLELDFHGDLGTFRYSFLGDGRVNFDNHLNNTDQKPAERWTAQLSDAELGTLVSDLIESGLHAFDPEAHLELERQAGIRRPSIIDGGWAEVGVSLVRRTSAGQGPPEVVAGHFGLSAELTWSTPVGWGTSWKQPEIPAIPELEAYRRITTLASEVRQRAVRVEVPPAPGDLSFPAGERSVLALVSGGTGRSVRASLTLDAGGEAVLESSLPGAAGGLTLTFEERKRILSLITEGGLADYDEKAVVRERQRLSRQVLPGDSRASDMPVFSVELRVVKERGPGLEPEVLARTIVVSGPAVLAQQFPALREYRALADLEELLFDLQSQKLYSHR